MGPFWARSFRRGSTGHLGGDDLGRLWVCGEDFDHLLTLGDSTAVDDVTQNGLLTVVVEVALEGEDADGLVVIDPGEGPAGEAAGDLNHILLGVGPIHAKRVQLEELK